MKTFPILRLPIIVIQDVLSMMNPFEMIHFSMTSRIAKLIGQMCWKNRRHIRYRFEIVVCKEPAIAFRRGERRWLYLITTNPDDADKKGNKEEIELNTEIIHKYFENSLEGMKTWFQIVQNIIQTDIGLFMIDTDDYPTQNKILIDWLKSQTSSVGETLFAGNNIADDVVTYFSTTIEIKMGLYLNVKLSDNFKPKLPYKLAKFEIYHGEWITMGHLLWISALKISIVHSSLTPQELRDFFLLWMNLRVFKHLQYFDIVIKSGEHLEALEDLPYTSTDQEEPIHVKSLFFEGEVQVGVEIKRCDGATGLLWWSESLHSEFGLLRFCLHSNE